MRVVEIDGATLSLLEDAMGEERQLIAARTARGCRCFGVFHGDALVGYGWLSERTEWIGEFEIEITPAAGEGYIWNCVTLAPHRRQGVFMSLVAGISSAAHRDGLRRLWIASLAIPAERALPSCGFTPVLHLETQTLAGFRWLRVTTSSSTASRLIEEARAAVSIRPRLDLRRRRHRLH